MANKREQINAERKIYYFITEQEIQKTEEPALPSHTSTLTHFKLILSCPLCTGSKGLWGVGREWKLRREWKQGRRKIEYRVEKE